MNQRMRAEARTSFKAAYRAAQNPAVRRATVRHISTKGRNYATGRIVVQGVSMRLPTSQIARRYAVVAAGAVGVGTIAYGFTSRVGRDSNHRVTRVYRRVAHASARTVAVPGQFAWGATKGVINTGSPIEGIRRGASRAMTSIEGTNSASGRRNTLSAKRRRDTIRRNAKARRKAAGGRGGRRSYYARDSRGRFK